MAQNTKVGTHFAVDDFAVSQQCAQLVSSHQAKRRRYNDEETDFLSGNANWNDATRRNLGVIQASWRETFPGVDPPSSRQV